MKRIVGTDLGSYAFAPGEPGVGVVRIVLPDNVPQIALEQVLIITNVTTGTILYNCLDPAKHGTMQGTTLTLAVDTSAMAVTDRLQIALDLPERPADPAQSFTGCTDMCEQPTFDTNLERVFGSQPLTDGGRLKDWVAYQDTLSRGRVGSSNEEFSIACSGCPTVTLQLSGTWAGTIAFEGTADGGNWAALIGAPLGGTGVATSTTAGGVWRFSSVGLSRVRVRFSTFTSGTAFTILVASPGAWAPLAQAQGSQSQALNQRATTYESNTYDTNLAAILGTAAITRPTVDPAAIAPSAPILPSTYQPNRWATAPQIYPRIRVEAAGDQRLPLAQDNQTNQLRVRTGLESLLELVLLQLQLLNQANINAGSIAPPSGWEEIR